MKINTVSKKNDETVQGSRNNPNKSTYLRSTTYTRIITLQGDMLKKFPPKKLTISEVVDEGLSLLEDRLKQL